MRWLWSPAPGMARVSSRRLIALQRSALRAADLEREARAAGAQVRAASAQVRAMELLIDRSLPAAVEADLLAELPVTGEGRLHEAAFLALADAASWRQWESQLGLVAPRP